jgi:mRNA interferase RelE/StbE
LADFRIFETVQFQKDLKQIARSGMPKLVNKLHDYVYPQLRSSPATGPNIKRLKGPYSDVWRYRIGAWRFFYSIDEKRRVVSLKQRYYHSHLYCCQSMNCFILFSGSDDSG